MLNTSKTCPEPLPHNFSPFVTQQAYIERRSKKRKKEKAPAEEAAAGAGAIGGRNTLRSQSIAKKDSQKVAE